jgi:hypothetical protein
LTLLMCFKIKCTWLLHERSHFSGKKTSSECTGRTWCWLPQQSSISDRKTHLGVADYSHFKSWC